MSAQARAARGRKRRRSVWLADLTYTEVAEIVHRPHVALVPVGSTEQHGPHLPLDVDMRLTASICEQAALAAAEDIGVVVAPPFAFGISEHHMAFPGTLTIDAETFVAVVYQVGRSLVRHGFDRIVIVNGHGGNEGALQIISARLRLQGGASHVIYLGEWDLARDCFSRLRESPPGGAAHACEYETSLYLHLRPEQVHMDAADTFMPQQHVEGTLPDLFTPGPYRAAFGHGVSATGVLGDPTLASAVKGRQLFEAAVENLERLLRQVALADGTAEPPAPVVP